MLFLSPRGDSWDTAHTGCLPPLVAQGQGLGERGEGNWREPALLGSNQLGRLCPC